MNEHWSAIAYMAKARESDLLEKAATVRANRAIKSKNNKNIIKNLKLTNTNYPSYYFFFHRIGKYITNFGVKIENKYKPHNYKLDIIRLDA